MNGPHDLGGRHGLGLISPEPELEEPVFHADWERQTFALTLACGMLGQWNMDEGRYARERQHPVAYLSNTYYENWLAGLETLLVEKGLVNDEELASGVSQGPAQGYRVPDAGGALKIITSGGPTRMDSNLKPAFKVGENVRVINQNPITHTRVPGYTRNHTGTIKIRHGVHVFADANAQGFNEGAHLYAVRFEAEELWGKGVLGDPVYVDLWEPHLEPI